MGTDPSRQDYGFLQPWVVGACVWAVVSMIILFEFKRTGDPRYLGEMCILLSFLWAEFGFAAIFTTIYAQRYDRLAAFTIVAALPPLTVCSLMAP
jgi:hypothetical protein